MKPRHYVISILELIVILGVLDIAGLYVFDELAVAGYLLIYFLPAIVLLALSIIGVRGDTGYLRAFDIIGITTSIGSILFAGAHFAFAYFAQ